MRYFRANGAVGLVGISLLLAAAGPANARQQLDAASRIEHAPLNELSGLARSSTYPGVFWGHNDSGSGPALFALKADGSVHVPAFHQASAGAWPGTLVLDADNVDWEDIAIADGVLYIAEMGNNYNARRDLGVYVVNEPNPDTSSIRALRFYPVVYPEQKTFPADRWEYDCEALFVDASTLYFLTKHRRAGEPEGWLPGSHLYRLRAPAVDRENALERLSTHPGIRLATAADLSPDGSKLAVLTYEHVWVFDRPADGSDDWFKGSAVRLAMPIPASLPAEAIAWIDDQSLLIGSENRNLYRASLADFAPAP